MAGAGGELEAELNRLVRVLRDATNRLEPMAREMVDALADYRTAYAKAVVMHAEDEGTVATRQAQAELDTADLFRKKILAEELFRVQRHKVDAVKEAIGAIRTLNSNARVLAGLE
jgi:hemerythrin-like domain-containing protein